jgi:hypothetical protein
MRGGPAPEGTTTSVDGLTAATAAIPRAGRDFATAMPVPPEVLASLMDRQSHLRR